MATYTTNLNLKKPASTDQYNVADMNGNMDTLDSAYDNLEKKTSVTVTLNQTNVSSGSVTVTKTGRVVNVRVGVTVSGSGTLQIATFSSSYAPSSSVYFIMLTGGVTSDTHNGKIGYVNSSGAISIYQCTDGAYIRGECTYII